LADKLGSEQFHQVESNATRNSTRQSTGYDVVEASCVCICSSWERVV